MSNHISYAFFCVCVQVRMWRVCRRRTWFCFTPADSGPPSLPTVWRKVIMWSDLK